MPRLTALIASVAAAATLARAQAPSPSAPPVSLPAPTGSLPIGTTSWQVSDSSRRESFASDRTARDVEVVAWYPAGSMATEPAPYLRWGLFEVQGFADLLGAGRNGYDHLNGVRTHAMLDAVPAAGDTRFPVIVFSAGYGGFASAHTSLFEDLASHGYAVLNIVHPYEVGAAKLRDGRLVSFLDYAGKPRQPYRDVVGEWGDEDAIMAAVTKATNDDERRRLLREYFAATPRTAAALVRWVDDTKFVLDQLAAVPRDGASGRLVSRLDLARIGVGGHSMGGVAAGQFCVQDARCRAGLNLDGIPQFGQMIDRGLEHPFLMVYSSRPGRLGASDVIYRRAKPYYRVDVANTGHLDFSDMILWGGPLRERNAFGALAPERVTAITRAIVLQYFDQVLLDRPSTLLEGKASFPEVTVTRP